MKGPHRALRPKAQPLACGPPEGSGVVWGSDGCSSGAKGSHRFEARPGHYLAPAELPSSRNVFEVLGTGFSLLVVGEEGEMGAHARAARHLAQGRAPASHPPGLFTKIY